MPCSDARHRREPGSQRATGVANLVELSASLIPQDRDIGVTGIARKTNYDFERREREKSKAIESAKKAQAKADKRAAGQPTADEDQSAGA